jgi:serine/threonine-protein kinase
MGNNGPSILLAIMTKDPVPPTVKAAGGRYPVPPALDDVLEEALAKNVNIRTKTVGALADAVGRAYGLEGDHLQWATMPQQEIAQYIAEAAPRTMRPRVAALSEAVDPFASPPSTTTAPMSAAVAPAPRRMVSTTEPDEPMGLPSRKPEWLLPVIVGLLALVVGGAVTLVVMTH